MAASANPSGSNHEHQASLNGDDGAAGSNPSNGNSAAGSPDNSALASAMKHNLGLATEWTADEQAILDDGLNKYSSETSIVRYAKLAMQLPNKTVRDVALRCRWMNGGVYSLVKPLSRCSPLPLPLLPTQDLKTKRTIGEECEASTTSMEYLPNPPRLTPLLLPLFRYIAVLVIHLFLC